MGRVRFFYHSCLGLAVWALGACGNSQAESLDDAAEAIDGTMVTAMYGRYIAGDYAAYVDLMESVDRATPEYRKQMIDLVKQRHRAQIAENGGPDTCRLVRVVPNDSNTYAEVYVEVIFKDRSFEEIMLPMVRVDNRWRLR